MSPGGGVLLFVTVGGLSDIGRFTSGSPKPTRLLLALIKVAPEITVVPIPVPESQFYSHGFGASLEQMRGIFHEYVAIIVYWWQGRI